MRYFFHVRDSAIEIEDDEGQDFANVADAMAYARLIIHELTDNARPGQYIDATLVVVDAQKNEIAKIPLE